MKDLWSDPRFKNKWNKIILPSSTAYYWDNGENINMECILIWVIILLMCMIISLLQRRYMLEYYRDSELHNLQLTLKLFRIWEGAWVCTSVHTYTRTYTDVCIHICICKCMCKCKWERENVVDVTNWSVLVCKCFLYCSSNFSECLTFFKIKIWGEKINPKGLPFPSILSGY